MQILAEDYKAVKIGDKTIIWNSLYESNTFIIFVAAIFELLLPDIKNFYVPLAIEVDANNEGINIDKKLNVTGTANYSYFIPKEHYIKWKKTYRFAFEIILLLEVMLDLLLMYIFFIKSQFHIISALAFLAVLSMTLYLIVVFYKQNTLIKKYGVREISKE